MSENFVPKFQVVQQLSAEKERDFAKRFILTEKKKLTKKQNWSNLKKVKFCASPRGTRAQAFFTVNTWLHYRTR